ncbi:hypothetical protein NDU88_007536 [Pleurodeles waltl]|uniref:Uncharacterized protein n=1 Tax=Pleurodeles waltl TaxID=8319 RepID=A0AAV7PM74_PLEWA|nr:hypothetical protein NDU88_007536 [Pleurodeles waltl]
MMNCSVALCTWQSFRNHSLALVASVTDPRALMPKMYETGKEPDERLMSVFSKGARANRQEPEMVTCHSRLSSEWSLEQLKDAHELVLQVTPYPVL